MNEIKTELLKLDAGETFTNGADAEPCFVIMDCHTINDVLRYLAGVAGDDGMREVAFLASHLADA